MSDRRIVFPARFIIAVGFIVFLVGLLVVLQEYPFFSAASWLIQDSISVLVFGAVVASVGQALVVFGAVKASSDKLYSSLLAERQLTMRALARNVEQVQTTMQNERQAVMASYSQTMARFNQVIAGQREYATVEQALHFECKFCGTRIEKGNFCPNCGKASQ